MQLVQDPCLKNSCKGKRGTDRWGAGEELLGGIHMSCRLHQWLTYTQDPKEYVCSRKLGVSIWKYLANPI